jgi:hypothetical protein
VPVLLDDKNVFLVNGSIIVQVVLRDVFQSLGQAQAGPDDEKKNRKLSHFHSPSEQRIEPGFRFRIDPQNLRCLTDSLLLGSAKSTHVSDATSKVAAQLMHC